ncbi:MAG: hypothetical protein VX681_08495 [Myxococcota bacterium]|nr:hypothetical protein [Myxococcota bacterium]
MSQDSTRWLRMALKANGVFSALSALVLLLGDGLVAALLGAFDALGRIHFVGLGLGVFAASLFWLATRDRIAPALTKAVIAADLLWVAGSGLAIATEMTSGQGTCAVAIVAGVVALLALAQGLALRWGPESNH